MKAILIDHMGNDDTVASAARVSFSKEAHHYSPEQNERLIKYLAKYNHFTPFTHCMITLHEKAPIFVARQRFKSTVGFTYNEVSRRYVNEAPEFFIPEVWRKKAENKKQGSSDEEVKTLDWCKGRDIKVGSVTKVTSEYKAFLEHAQVLYEVMLKNGVAPEQARMVLPQSMYTEYYVTGSLAAFARAYKLRNEESAQKEIQDLAVKWDEIIRPLFPQAWSALVDG